MATYDASVKKALSPQQKDLIDHKEHCSADPEKLATVGRALGHQVRIKRNDSQYGLYTVSEVRQESPDNIVRMGRTGRRRLGTDGAFACTLDSQVPHPTFTDEQQARDHDEFIEQLKDDGRHTGLIVIAPHGGDIERHTDQQAERVASLLAAKGVSSWRRKGYKRGGALDAWHITSTRIHEANFPRLNSVISRGFTYAVAFHGFGGHDILIGGTAPHFLKQEIKAAIEGAIAGSGITVRIARPDEGFNGDDPRNIVNRLTAGGANGIQIEQSLRARSRYGQAIADAVANVYNPKIPQGPVTVVEPKTSRDSIFEQYVVLKATLAGPTKGRIDASTNEQITLDDGSKTTILEKDTSGSVTKINFPTNPPDFFAPFPPIVEWNLPEPQPPIPARLEGTRQPCRSERCGRDVFRQGVGRSLLGPYERTP